MLGRSFFLRPFYARTISSLSSSKEATHTCNPRWLVAFCFSATGDGFDFHGAAYALNHAFGGIPKLFFSEVAHIAVFLHKGKRIPVSHHEASPTNDMKDQSDIFIFKDGSMVLWGFPEEYEGKILSIVQPFRDTRSDEALLPSISGAVQGPSREELKWCFGKKFGYDKASDVLVLSNPDVASNETKTMQQNTLEKVALSHGLQRSVKMDRLEIYMNSLVRSLKAMPQDIILDVVPHSESGHNRVLQKMGEILYLRDVLNLRGCLDTPKAYWNKPELEEMYNRIWNEFELGNRIFLLNQKLDYAHELVDARRIQLVDARQTRLTLYIILLICVSIVFNSKKVKHLVFKDPPETEEAKDRSQG